ncbi:MAG: class I SAM-dependent methyltransferase [Gammaproteobacteria bacterium]
MERAGDERGELRVSGAGSLSPKPEAAAHSARLIEAIREELAASGGSMSFARYMELALYAPGLGYYSAGSTKLGASGDFITAPELSPLFGRCLARPCREVLARLGGGIICELGAGTGRLAVEILTELERLDSLPEAYFILEISADLRARQREWIESAVPHLAPRIAWLERPPSEPWRGIMIANEVLDALPVHRFRVAAGKLYEQHVGWQADGFAWGEEVPAEPCLRARIEAIQGALGSPLPEGYVSEVNLALTAWLGTVTEFLNRGIFLCIDYGYTRREYYLPERCGGTLMCHYRHRVHADPLILIGLQDISSYVDFTAVAESAEACGLAVLGYATQAHFLIGCGLEEVLKSLGTADPPGGWYPIQDAKRLILPQGMGERFKVMALGRAWDGPLMGFQEYDQRHRL